MAYLVFHSLIKIINYKWRQNIDIFSQKGLGEVSVYRSLWKEWLQDIPQEGENLT